MDQDAANWDHCLEHAAETHVGLRRANNQDAMAVTLAGSQQLWQQRGHFFMVADGMGAHAAGELASKMATDIVGLTYQKLVGKPAPEAIRAAIHDANEQIHNRGQASPDFRGMGTTSTVLLLLPQGAVLGHVGDTRAYRLRGNRFEQLTFDHSLVWEMRAAKKIPENEIPQYVPKNIITRSLGPNHTVRIDLEGPFPLRVGDTFLLCSDGLSGPVADEEIGTVLQCLPPQKAVRALIDLANLRGGPDNITVIVVRITGPQVAAQANPRPEAPATAPPLGTVHPVVWTLLGVLALAAVGMAALGRLTIALICAVAAAVAAVVAMIQRFGSEDSDSGFEVRRLGRGPYQLCKCEPNGQFTDQLTEMVDQLRDAATKEQWTIDWSRFNGYRDRAEAAKQSGDQAAATREYLHAISFMMVQLRHQRDAGSGSSLLER